MNYVRYSSELRSIEFKCYLFSIRMLLFIYKLKRNIFCTLFPYIYYKNNPIRVIEIYICSDSLLIYYNKTFISLYNSCYVCIYIIKCFSSPLLYYYKLFLHSTFDYTMKYIGTWKTMKEPSTNPPIARTDVPMKLQTSFHVGIVSAVQFIVTTARSV